MSNPTTPFSWQMPTATDLVTDLPADFEVFGQAVATSMADLLGGTSGQILAKNSNTDMDFVWIANDQGDITAVTAGTGISGGGTSGAVTITNSMATEITAKGDLIVGTGSATFDNLAAGANGSTLVTDSTTSTGLKYVTKSAVGGAVLVKSATFSNVATTGTTFDGVFTTTYSSYLVVFDYIYASTSPVDVRIQMRNAASTLSATQWFYCGNLYNGSGSVTQFKGNGQTSYTVAQTHTSQNASLKASFTVFNVGISSQPTWIGNAYDGYNGISGATGATYGSAGSTDGFILSASSGNIYGSVSIYGLAVA